MQKNKQLAINGGTAVRSDSWPPWPNYADDEIDAVTKVLKSGKVNYWTGKECERFEVAFAKHCLCDYAVAVANGSVALELALYALGIGPGDEVIVPCKSFIASASSIVMRGATPVFADVDIISQNITVAGIEKALSKKTRAIIAVHLAGWPCAMDEIIAFANANDLYVIEDCAQAHGAKYAGKPVGSFGHASAFSFCQDKIMSTGGEGGMLVTNDNDLWQRAWEYKDHGKSHEAVFSQQAGGGFRWVHESFGTNWRMTEIQAAIGLCQLDKLNDWHASRVSNASLLYAGLTEIPGLITHMPEKEIDHAYYKFYCFIERDKLRNEWNKDQIIDAINSEGVPCGGGSCSEIYREKAFIDADLVPAERFPVAMELAETSLMFQVHPTLTAVEIEDTVVAIRKVMEEAVN